jgi:hypothetical protein
VGGARRWGLYRGLRVFRLVIDRDFLMVFEAVGWIAFAPSCAPLKCLVTIHWFMILWHRHLGQLVQQASVRALFQAFQGTRSAI